MYGTNKHLSIAFKDAHFLLLKQIENGLKIEEALTERTTFNSVSHCCKKIAQDRSSYSFLVFYGKLIPYLKMSKHFLKCFRISTIDLKIPIAVELLLF